MDKAKILTTANASAAFALALLASTPAGRVEHGSLVVAEVSEKGDYVVAGAESRKGLVVLRAERGNDVGVPTANAPNDRACKIVGLGGDTLFFETGNSVISLIGVDQGKWWDAVSVARASYRESKRRDAKGLSITWANKALQWFSDKTRQDLQSVVEGSDGGIVTGGFIKFDDGATPSIQGQTIFYSVATDSLTRRPAFQPPGFGLAISGTGPGVGLVKEFGDGKTERAVKAWGPDWRLFDCCRTPTIDSDVVRRSIQFAIDNSTGEDKRTLGGPIDIAILRKNRTIEWISRKTECYALDVKPTRTMAPSTGTRTESLGWRSALKAKPEKSTR